CEYDAAAQRLYMIAGSNDGSIRLLHVGAASMEHIRDLPSGHTGVVRGFDWDMRDGWAVSGGEDGRLVWWSQADQAQAAVAGPKQPAAARSGATSRRFAPY
ncbi:hypothetical protein H4R19_004676, partial [Coemansia spiralis]